MFLIINATFHLENVPPNRAILYFTNWVCWIKKKKSHGKWAVWRGVCGYAGRKMYMDFLVLIVGMNDKEILQITTKQESLSSIGNIDLYKK